MRAPRGHGLGLQLVSRAIPEWLAPGSQDVHRGSGSGLDVGVSDQESWALMVRCKALSPSGQLPALDSLAEFREQLHHVVLSA